MDFSEDYIDAFLNHQLDEQAAQEFENHLRQSPELQKKVERQIMARLSVEIHGRNAVREDLKEIHNQYVKGGKVKRMTFYWGIAASISAILAIMAYLGSRPAPVNNQELFAAYFEPIQQKVLFNTSRRGSDEESRNFSEIWKNVEENFNTADYQAAKQVLDSLILDTSFENRADIRLARAWIYLQEKDTRNAIEILEKLDSFSFQYHRNWFLALAYLQDNRKEKAQNMLLKISQNTGSPYHKAAFELHRKLE